MKRKYFGTDGIRGEANKFPMTAAIALKVGQAAGLEFKTGEHRNKVVIAKDTRLSGYMIESALVAGFTSVGVDVIQVGPMPTPSVALLTRSMRADMGVMISASHNAYKDNGIKLFSGSGLKLSDEVELSIEKRLDEDLSEHLAEPDKLGRAKRIDDAVGRYIEFAKSTLPRNMRLDGMKIVIDCANGAAYKIAPLVLWELGATVIAVGNEPNGFNVNEECGSTHPEKMCEAVREHGADLGIALDGDADRVVLCDEKGEVVDGDQLLALIITHWSRTRGLRNDAVAVTQMSNIGLERYLRIRGIDMIRTGVGDRYVLETMHERDLSVGGEQSGHIILIDYNSTGDGLIAALQALAAIISRGRKASDCLRMFEPVPQLLKNIRFKGGDPLGDAKVKAMIADFERELGGGGRIFVRKSGTEPLIRIMIEGEDEKRIHAMADELANLIESKGKKAA